MQDEDRKVLTEFLGECWFNIDNFDDEGICKICGECWEVHHNRTFDTWEDFGALIERVEEKDQWDDLFLFGYLPYHKTEGPLIILKAINAGVIK